MAKTPPTLADGLIREWMRPRYRRVDPNNWVSNHIAQARKFVLDESMSAFMADLSYVSLNACKTPAKRKHLVDSMRHLARLPHALTWVEYDKQAHRKRVKEAYHPDIVAEPDSVPDRSGWLLMQHPKLDTAFMALHCTSHSWDESNVRQELPNAGQFAYAWTCDDTIPPWPRDPFYHSDRLCRIDHADKDMMTSPAGVLTGVLEYRTESLSIIAAPYVSREADALFKRMAGRHFNPLGELSHDARYLWSLLATINDLPTELQEVKPDRGYVARGRYRKFSDHTVITLTVPTRRYRQLANRAIAIARRRAHQVRGFWRRDWRNPLSVFCEHNFSADEQRMECKHCKGRKLWVHEHQRGSAALGFVLHDYTVKHDPDPPHTST